VGLNLIDHIIEGDDLLEGALAYTQQLLAEKAPLRKVRDITIDPASFDPAIFDQFTQAAEPVAPAGSWRHSVLSTVLKPQPQTSFR